EEPALEFSKAIGWLWVPFTGDNLLCPIVNTYTHGWWLGCYDRCHQSFSLGSRTLLMPRASAARSEWEPFVTKGV
ncbi:hypothetical protein, partial [Moorena producens]|uniref:hypothetical protein n=1 Tax=Moorena producens TaxID=1155739 RepID=UPI001A95C18D